MKKQTIIVIILTVFILALASGTIFVLSLASSEKAEKEKAEKEVVSLETFSAWTDIAEFQSVPALKVEGTKIGEFADYGDDNYLVSVNGTKVSDYENYLNTLENAGFVKHSDNGKDAMEGNVMTASFMKDNLTVTVSHAVSQDKTYISASYDLALSDYMIYKDEYMNGVTEGAETKLHMMEINDNGACFIIQLKNGHFIVHDGGKAVDAPYLLDYLESLTPGDEVPVIEAWFISHSHGDHYGALSEISRTNRDIKRIKVNGFYYHVPPSDIVAQSYDASPSAGVFTASKLYSAFKNENGERSAFYRPQLGQRYYFCDITIDVCMTPEQYSVDAYYKNGSNKIDMNDTSIWLMHNIEGQKTLIGGDAFHTGIRAVMNSYEQTYLDLDVFVILHHGINVYDYFTNYTTVKTVLYPNFRVGSIWEPSRADLAAVEGNATMMEAATECLSCENGSVVLTFPYKVGEAEIMEPCDWRYTYGKRQKSNWE